MNDMKTVFSDQTSDTKIDLSESLIVSAHLQITAALSSHLPAIETMHIQPQQVIEHQIFDNIYPDFVRYQMSLAASQALINNHSRYEGLGDSFCLTDPGYV